MVKKLVLFIALSTMVYLANAQQVPLHQPWDELLKKHVNNKGLVDYKGFMKDRAALKHYLDLLNKYSPQDNWSRSQQIAYWINAYNAFTIELILEHYPVKSIKDIAGNIYKINTPWDIKFIRIGGEKYDLNNIEHGILRKKFDDPRIHFALVCASISCPRLRNEAFTSPKLESQLEAAGKEFLNDPAKNKISTERAYLSKYFSWYKGDFTKNASLTAFINRYSNTKIDRNTRISYLDYNWKLNEQ
jgi:hypothetical protein